MTSVSAVVCVRNCAPFLSYALDSVLNQTRPPDEIVAVVGPSTDGTLELVRNFDHVRCVEQPDAGLGAARNLGLEATSAETVAFLDGDDIWTADKLEVQLGLLDNDINAQGVTGLLERFDWTGNPPEPGTTRYDRHEAFTPGCLLARRSLFAKLGPFRTDLTLAVDHEWFIRASRVCGSIRLEPMVWLYKGMHQDNLSLDRKAYRQELMRVVRAHAGKKGKTC